MLEVNYNKKSNTHPYTDGKSWIFPAGNLGKYYYLNQEQMQDVVNYLLTEQPMKDIQMKPNFQWDPRIGALTFSSKERILDFWAATRPRVKRK